MVTGRGRVTATATLARGGCVAEDTQAQAAGALA